MTDEIIKLYKNAGINQVCNTCELRGFKRLCPTKELCVRTNPPFTAEKQIELIKTIETKCDFVDCIQLVYRPMEDLWKISIIPVLEMAFEEMHLYFGCDKDFSTALAMAINNLWQDLTEEEKQQVKGILE